MKTAFLETLASLADRDPRLWLLAPGTDRAAFGPFAERFPERVCLVGAAEQALLGIASGLAQRGKLVFVVLSGRTVLPGLAQLRGRLDQAQGALKIVALGGSEDDLAAARAVPDLMVVAPGGAAETVLATEAIAREPGPCFLRIDAHGGHGPCAAQPRFVLGEAITVRQGRDVTLMTTGGALAEALRAANRFAAYGIEARVVNMHTLVPLDAACVLRASIETGAVVTIEAHGRTGGLGTAVAEVLASAPGPRAALVRVALPVTVARPARREGPDHDHQQTIDQAIWAGLSQKQAMGRGVA